MTTTTRPSGTRKVTATDKAKADAADEKALDQGIAFTDVDGKRVQVRVRDVKGIHDAALVAAIGTDFMGLLEMLTKRQGLDLLAAVIWFGRLVNGREELTYQETLADFSYGDVLALDVDEPKTEDDSPEARGSRSPARGGCLN